MPFDKRFITVICLLVFIIIKIQVMHINRHTDTRYSYTKRVKGSHAMVREYNTSCHISHTTQCRSLAIGSE